MSLGLVSLTAALLSIDAGDARLDTKRILDALLLEDRWRSAVQRIEAVETVRAARDQASGEERQILDRLLRFAQADDPLHDDWSDYVQLNRDLVKLARGDWSSERAAVAAFTTLPSLAGLNHVDPEPLRREAAQLLAELVARWPEQGRAHGMAASFALSSGAEPVAALPGLKRCVQLDPTADWCRKLHARLVADAERPRCSGRQLAQTLTSRGAHEWQKGQNGAVIESYGQKLLLEERPFLLNEDYAVLTVDGEGALNITVTSAAKQRLATETARLRSESGFVVMKLAEEVVLSARVLEPISDGRVRINPGKGGSFSLEKLCRTTDRPQLPAALKLP